MEGTACLLGTWESDLKPFKVVKGSLFNPNHDVFSNQVLSVCKPNQTMTKMYQKETIIVEKQQPVAGHKPQSPSERIRKSQANTWLSWL